MALNGSIGAGGNTYGSALVPGAVSYSDLVSGDTVTATVNVNTAGNTSSSGNLKVGSYGSIQSVSALGGADAGNYSIGSFSDGGYTVSQLALSGTIAAGTSVYGSALAPGAVTLSGVMLGDTVTPGTAGVDTTTVSGSGKPIVGSYTQSVGTTLGGTDAGNYSFAGSTSAANYTITQLALNGSIGAGGNTYGSALVPGAVSYSDLVSGDTVTATVNVNTAGNTSSSGNLKVGSYGSIQSVSALGGADAGNYSIGSFSDGGYTVSQLALNIGGITVSNKVYDGTTTASVDTNGASYSGLVGGDVVTVAASGSFSDKNVGIGKTVILSSSYSGGDVGNYSITDQASTTADITAAALTIAANAASKNYDGTAYSGGNGVTYSGFVNGENSSVLSGALVYGGTSQGAIDVGTYSIDPSGLSDSNYNITYQNGQLQIIPETTVVQVVVPTTNQITSPTDTTQHFSAPADMTVEIANTQTTITQTTPPPLVNEPLYIGPIGGTIGGDPGTFAGAPVSEGSNDNQGKKNDSQNMCS